MHVYRGLFRNRKLFLRFLPCVQTISFCLGIRPCILLVQLWNPSKKEAKRDAILDVDSEVLVLLQQWHTDDQLACSALKCKMPHIWKCMQSANVPVWCTAL